MCSFPISEGTRICTVRNTVHIIPVSFVLNTFFDLFIFKMEDSLSGDDSLLPKVSITTVPVEEDIRTDSNIIFDATDASENLNEATGDITIGLTNLGFETTADTVFSTAAPATLPSPVPTFSPTTVSPTISPTISLTSTPFPPNNESELFAKGHFVVTSY